MYKYTHIYVYMYVYIYRKASLWGGYASLLSHVPHPFSYSLSSTTVNAQVPVVNQEWVCVSSPSWLRQFVTILIPSPEDWSGVPVSVFKYMYRRTRMYTCMCKIIHVSIRK